MKDIIILSIYFNLPVGNKSKSVLIYGLVVGGSNAGMTEISDQIFLKFNSSNNNSSNNTTSIKHDKKEIKTYQFKYPTGMALSSSGKVIIVDNGSGTINEIDQSKINEIDDKGKPILNMTTTLRSFEPYGIVALPQHHSMIVSSRTYNKIYVFDETNFLLRKTLGRELGYIDGPADNARFNQPCGLARLSNGNILVADYGNNAIRMLSSNLSTVSTISISYDKCPSLVNPPNSNNNFFYNGTFLYHRSMSDKSRYNVVAIDKPVGIAVIPDGRVIVSTSESKFIVISEKSGQQIDSDNSYTRYEEEDIFIKGLYPKQKEEYQKIFNEFIKDLSNTEKEEYQQIFNEYRVEVIKLMRAKVNAYPAITRFELNANDYTDITSDWNGIYEEEHTLARALGGEGSRQSGEEEYVSYKRNERPIYKMKDNEKYLFYIINDKAGYWSLGHTYYITDINKCALRVKSDAKTPLSINSAARWEVNIFRRAKWSVVGVKINEVVLQETFNNQQLGEDHYRFMVNSGSNQLIKVLTNSFLLDTVRGQILQELVNRYRIDSIDSIGLNIHNLNKYWNYALLKRHTDTGTPLQMAELSGSTKINGISLMEQYKGVIVNCKRNNVFTKMKPKNKRSSSNHTSEFKLIGKELYKWTCD